MLLFCWHCQQQKNASNPTRTPGTFRAGADAVWLRRERPESARDSHINGALYHCALVCSDAHITSAVVMIAVGCVLRDATQSMVVGVRSVSSRLTSASRASVVHTHKQGMSHASSGCAAGKRWTRDEIFSTFSLPANDNYTSTFYNSTLVKCEM